MALLKWTVGDTITERSANNKGVRKGTEGELAGIVVADREDGDVLWNSTNGQFGVPQIQLDATADDRSNVHILLALDSNEVSIVGSTPTQVKDSDFAKDSGTEFGGFTGNQITIVARLKQTGGGTTTLIMEVDGGPTDEITITSTSATFEMKTGFFDASGLAAGYHTLEFFISNAGGTSAQLQLLEIWGL